MSRKHGLSAQTMRDLVAIGAGLLLIFIAAEIYGYSREAAVLLGLIGALVICAGVLEVVHTLPPDSSPF